MYWAYFRDRTRVLLEQLAKAKARHLRGDGSDTFSSLPYRGSRDHADLLFVESKQQRVAVTGTPGPTEQRSA